MSPSPATPSTKGLFPAPLALQGRVPHPPSLPPTRCPGRSAGLAHKCLSPPAGSSGEASGTRPPRDPAGSPRSAPSERDGAGRGGDTPSFPPAPSRHPFGRCPRRSPSLGLKEHAPRAARSRDPGTPRSPPLPRSLRSRRGSSGDTDTGARIPRRAIFGKQGPTAAGTTASVTLSFGILPHFSPRGSGGAEGAQRRRAGAGRGEKGRGAPAAGGGAGTATLRTRGIAGLLCRAGERPGLHSCPPTRPGVTARTANHSAHTGQPANQDAVGGRGAAKRGRLEWQRSA